MSKFTPQVKAAIPVQQRQDVVTVVAASTAPSHEQIARRAYELYVGRGYQQGQNEQNWQQAEQYLRERAFVALRTESDQQVWSAPAGLPH